MSGGMMPDLARSVVGNGIGTTPPPASYKPGPPLPLPSTQTFQSMQRITPQVGAYNPMQGIQRTQMPQQTFQMPQQAPQPAQGGK